MGRILHPGFLPDGYGCLGLCLLVLFYLTFANILGVIFAFYRYKFNDNIRDTAQLKEKISRVVLKILDLSFLPILVFSVSAAFRPFRCHFVKSHQSHSPLCSFFNLQKHIRKKNENQRDIIFSPP